jgi:GNAT superfamily N-acetyltransferase
MIVRKMLPSEIDLTINLFSQYFDEAAVALPEIADEYNEDAVLETIKMYNTHYEYVWYNAVEGQRPVGFVAGCITPVPWSSDKVDAHIVFIYLLESHRNMDNFRQLLNKFEEWAHNIGAAKITAGDIGINPERTQKLYEYFEFKPGIWMSKELG